MFKKKKIGNNNDYKAILLNLIKIRQSYLKSKKTKSIITSIFGIIAVFLIILLGIGITNQVSNLKLNFNNILGFVGVDLKFDNVSSNIKKSVDGKTNILIIGRGGEENDAPNLTDSIILSSINYDKKTISMFSIPRDLYVKYPTGFGGKINETYARAMMKTKNEADGIKSLNEVVTKMTGEEIHYYVNLDFEGFRKIVDTIGGIDVNVPEKIIDTSYPGPNWSYQTFKIEAGPQTLDGSTALKYARSRHSTSDFDRSLRQQLIVKAIRDKVLSLGLLTSPTKIKSVFSIIKQHITTDLDNSQIIALAMFLRDIPKENITSSNLNDTCFYGSVSCEKGGFLYVPDRASFGGAAVLLQEGATASTSDNYDSIVKYTNIIFNYPLVYSENLKINVFNATKNPGLANDIADKLKKYGFNIPSKGSVGNTSGEKYEKSKILYTTGTGGEKPETVEALENFIFGGSEKVENLPKYSKDPQVKIEIIIGDDYKLLNF